MRSQFYQNRILTLDILRAAAILLVLFRHIEILNPHVTDSSYGKVLGPLINAGWIGVDLFFVLSGFLIGSLLFKELQLHGNVNISRFFIRRGFKIYPQYYTFYLLSTAPHVVLHLGGSYLALLGEAVFIQNYTGIIQPHTWSLAVEEHFYIFMMLLFSLFSRLNVLVHTMPILCAGFMYYGLYGRIHHFESTTSGPIIPYFLTHLRIETLLVGALLSYIKYYWSEIFKKLLSHPLLTGSIGLLFIFPNFILNFNQSIFLHTYGFSLNAIGFSCILLYALSRDKACHSQRSKLRDSLILVGQASYGIYLWHVVVARSLNNCINWKYASITTELLVIGAYFILSITIGLAFTYLLEMPLLRQRDRLYPNRYMLNTTHSNA